MMDAGFTSQVVDEFGIRGTDYIDRKRAGSLSSSNPLLARRIKNRISSAMGTEHAPIDVSRRSSSSDLSEEPMQEGEIWSGNMDIDSDDQGQDPDDELQDEGSSDMGISE